MKMKHGIEGVCVGCSVQPKEEEMSVAGWARDKSTSGDSVSKATSKGF